LKPTFQIWSLKSVPRLKMIHNNRGLSALSIGMDMGSWSRRLFPYCRAFCSQRSQAPANFLGARKNWRQWIERGGVSGREAGT
jgi:hypothetical protein